MKCIQNCTNRWCGLLLAIEQPYWGLMSFVNAVQHRAYRFFLGLGNYASNAAVNGEMGWTPPIVKQWKTVISHWARLNKIDNNRLNYNIFKWNYHLMGSHKNWFYRVKNELIEVADLTLVIKNVYSNRDVNAIITRFQSKLFDRTKKFECDNKLKLLSVWFTER